MEDLYIIRPDYTPTSKLYDFKKPEIPTGDTYYFTTDSGLEYQVRFGKKRENYLGNIVNFSVLSDEFEDEYDETNRGEVYRIIATVVEIVRVYHSFHSHSDTYEFTGEFKDRIPMGFKFHKLYARNYRVYEKNDLWIWVMKREVNLKDLHGNSGVIIKLILDGKYPVYKNNSDSTTKRRDARDDTRDKGERDREREERTHEH